MKILYYKIRAVAVTWLLRLLPRNQPVVFTGLGSSLSLCRQIALLGYSKILIVTDQFLNESGMLNDVKETLGSAGVEFEVYDGILPDPVFEQVEEGAALLRENGCEAVLGVGGGSVLDAAKMVALLHTNPGDLASYDRIRMVKNPGLTMFAIPTTAGTGSEITPASVITDSKTHRKVAVADGKLVPHYVALDAELMKTMPPHITAATGMDALTHAVESYLSKAATPSTRELAASAARLTFKYLPRAWREGDDMEAREAMALAAFQAGFAFGRTSVGYAHGIAHQLGRVCGTPHGEANAMVLPEVLTAYGACVHQDLAELAIACELADPGTSSEQAASLLIQHITELRDGLKLPLKPGGLESKDIPGIVKAALAEAGDIYPVPRYMSAEEIESIVEELLPAA
jgi:alcohol dehydrogenase class IV